MNINNLEISSSQVLKKESDINLQRQNQMKQNQNQTKNKTIKYSEQDKKKYSNNVKKIENLHIIQEQENAYNNEKKIQQEFYYEPSCSPKYKEMRGQLLPQIRNSPNNIQLIQKFDLYHKDQPKVRKEQMKRNNFSDTDSFNHSDQILQNYRDSVKLTNVNILVDRTKNQKIMRYENNLLKLLNQDKKNQQAQTKTNRTNPDVLQNSSIQYYSALDSTKKKFDKKLDTSAIKFDDLLQIEELDSSKIKHFQPEKIINSYQEMNDVNYEEKYQSQLQIIRQKQQDLKELIVMRESNQIDLTQNIIKQKIKCIKNSIKNNTQKLNLYSTFQKDKNDIQINFENDIRASSMNIQYRLQKEKEKNQQQFIKKQKIYSEDSVKDDTTIDSYNENVNQSKSNLHKKEIDQNTYIKSQNELNDAAYNETALNDIQKSKQNQHKRQNPESILRKKVENQLKLKYSKIENQLDIDQTLKLNQYLYFIQMINFSNNQIVNAPSSDFQPYKIFVAKGNNSQLVRTIFKQRWWWSVVKDETIENIKLYWCEYGKNSIFQKMQALPLPYQTLNHNYQQSDQAQILSIEDQKYLQETNKLFKINSPLYIEQIQKKIQLNKQEKLTFTLSHNHLEKSYNLSDKKALFYNIKNFALSSKQDPFQFIPLTFHIKDGIDDTDYKKFLEYYNKQKVIKLFLSKLNMIIQTI